MGIGTGMITGAATGERRTTPNRLKIKRIKKKNLTAKQARRYGRYLIWHGYAHFAICQITFWGFVLSFAIPCGIFAMIFGIGVFSPICRISHVGWENAKLGKQWYNASKEAELTGALVSGDGELVILT